MISTFNRTINKTVNKSMNKTVCGTINKLSKKYNINKYVLYFIFLLIIVFLIILLISLIVIIELYFKMYFKNKLYRESYNNYQINYSKYDIGNEYVLPRVIYGYWDNLEENEIIQAHVNTWYRNVAPGWKVVMITRKNVHNYVDPEFLEKFKNIDAVRFSDFLRVYLLSKNGGVWMDAGTILINGDFLEKYREEMIRQKIDILIYEFKAHSKPEQPYLENWFLMSPKGSLFITDLYNEFNNAYDMDFVKYKHEVLAPKINFENSMGDGDGTYHMQHGIIHFLLKSNKNRYNMSIKDAEESMFKAQKINEWDSERLIKYIIDNPNLSDDYYAIKLVGFNRAPIQSCKTEFINKLNNL
jgi:phage shock protein PspC (stress-responsive transcriptional regulator)